MKKISLLLVGVLALFSCEQEELDSFVKGDIGQVQTRAESSIADFDPLAELSEIPVNIINMGNEKYKYLSADAQNDAIYLAQDDDGSLRQRWYMKLGLVLVGGHTPFSEDWAMMPKIGKNYPILENCQNFYDISAAPRFNIKSDSIYEIYQQRLVLSTTGGLYGGCLQPKDKNSSTLIYKSEGTPPLSYWKVIPVGEFNIVKMEYEKSATYNDFIERQDIYIEGATFGDSPREVEHVFNVSHSKTSKSSFTKAEGVAIQSQNSFGFSLGFGDASKVHIGFDGEISKTITSSETLTWGKETTETMSVSQTFTVPIPAHTPCRVEILWRTFRASITYVATLEKVDGIAAGKRFRIKGKWNGVTSSDLYYNIYDIVDNKLLDTRTVSQ